RPLHYLRRRVPPSPLLPYTTLFRSLRARPASSTPVPRPAQRAPPPPNSAAASAAAEVVLPMPISPTQSRSISGTTASNPDPTARSEEHTSELQSREKLVCRLLLEKK